MNAEAIPLVADLPARPVRPMQWLVRRELWEHRALYIVPVVVVIVIMAAMVFGWIIGSSSNAPMPHFETFTTKMAALIVTGVNATVGSLLALVMPVVWLFYCMDALHAERRDRSILFWKSLPVSDLETVLSKLLTVTVVAPLIQFVVLIATQLLIMLVCTVVFALHGHPGWKLWTQPAFLATTVMAAYTMAVYSLWVLPLYGWLLLTSVWARRATFLWAMLPPIAIIVIEKIAFGTARFATMLLGWVAGLWTASFDKTRLTFQDNFVVDEKTGRVINEGPDNLAGTILSSIDPYGFITSPQLWIGIALAAVFIAATVALRRYREPL